jgi:hypothetical protein
MIRSRIMRGPYRVPRHAGNLEQPQNCVPALLPFCAVLRTIAALQAGH